MALTRRSSGPTATASGQAGGAGAGGDPYSMITDRDPDTRRRAVLALANRPEAAETLITHVGEEPDPAVRQATLTVLVGFDTVAVASSLMRFVRGDDAVLRNAALEAIAAMPTAAAELVPELLADPDPDVRILTAMLLEEMPRQETVPWLISMLTADDHPNVISAALDAFLPFAASEHVGFLGEVRDRFPDDPFIQFTLDAALPGLAGR